VAFYNAVLEDPVAVSAAAGELLPLSREDYYPMRDLLNSEQIKEYPLAEQGAMAFIISRHSYAGIMTAGYAGYHKQHERCARYAREVVPHFYSPNLSVECSDFEDFLQKNWGEFVYADPPYWDFVGLRSYPTTRKKRMFKHHTLARLLKARGNFLLSYNDCSEVRELYAEYEMVEIAHKYSFRKDRKTEVGELLIIGV